MAVLKSEDGKELLVDCSCGCNEGLRISIKKDEDGYAYLSYVSGNFYNGQGSTFARKLKKIWRILRGKDYVYSEICMTEAEFEEFKDYISKA